MICNIEERRLREELAYAYRLAAHFKWDDLIYGHLSVRLPSQPECYLINPFGLMFEEITPDNLLKVDFFGNILNDNPYHYNPAGENIHNAIYTQRADIYSVVHLHSPNGMTVSMLDDPILPLSQHSCHLHERIAFHDYEGIAVEREEQSRLVNDLGEHDIMILRNHGLLTIGKNIAQAFCTMYMLEKSIEAQIRALSTGQKLRYLDNDICKKVINQAADFGSNKNYMMEWDALLRMIKKKTDFLSYKKNLEPIKIRYN